MSLRNLACTANTSTDTQYNAMVRKMRAEYVGDSEPFTAPYSASCKDGAKCSFCKKQHIHSLQCTKGHTTWNIQRHT
jgi:hypothetical protein